MSDNLQTQQKQNDSPQTILQALKSSKNILIIMDSRFDYDALGSVLAFSDALKQFKILHTCIYGYNIPAKPKEYFDTSRIQENVDLKTFDYSPYDLIVYLDCGMLEHITKTYDYRSPQNKTTIDIDHHAGNNFYGTLNYIDIKASTCSVLYDLFKIWQIDITPEICDYLLAGQTTDTGILQFNSVTSRELTVIADLIERGGRYFDFVNFLTMNESYEEMVVKGLVYSNLVVDKSRKFAYSILLGEDLQRKGITEFGVVPADLIKKLQGMDFVFVIRTDPLYPESWHISLRSHNMDYSVLEIAQKIYGSGHRVAAGCSIPFSQAKTVEDVVEKIWQVAKENQGTLVNTNAR